MSNFELPFKNKIEENKKILYKNARIIDPKTNYDKIGNLLTIGDKISDFGENVNDEQAQIVECNGHVLCPGLIDIQVHFRDPGQTHKEDLESGSRSAVAGGVTTVVCQPNTDPTIDTALTLEYLTLKAKESAYCNIKAYGCVTKEMKGQELTNMHELKEAGAVGFTDDGLPVMNAHLMRQAFKEAKKFDMVVAQHAEDLNLSNKGCINEGKVSEKLQVNGIPNISESVIVKRDLEILEDTGGRYHLLHVSTKQALDAIRQAKKKGLNATVEVCPHHFTLNHETVLREETNAKMNPPLRSEEDRSALIEGLRDGTIDAISTDHAPHDKESKDKPLSEAAFGIVGLETLLPLSLNLFHQNILSLSDTLAKLTFEPAKIINFDGGVLKSGARADLTLIDLGHEWTLDAKNLHSKSKNTPFDGYKLQGKAIKTIVAGKIVYEL